MISDIVYDIVCYAYDVVYFIIKSYDIVGFGLRLFMPIVGTI